MPLIPAATITSLQGVATDIRNSDSESITISRVGTAQTVRITPPSAQAIRRGDIGGLEQSDNIVMVVGAIDFNVAVGDRFKDSDGIFYEVVLVRPNRTIRTVAIARTIQ
jgi:hypothetical protein